MNIESSTYSSSDYLSRADFAQRLEKYLLIDHRYVDGSLVVSLNGKYGFGKSTFLHMWKNDLLERREKGEKVPAVIYLNAWENDYCGDPLLSIITKLMEVIGEITQSKESKSKIRQAASQMSWFAMGLANSFVASKMGIDTAQAAEFAEKRRSGKSIEPPDIVALYNYRTGALQTLLKELRNVFNGDDVKAFIFVDELDRCRPEFTIQFLETIKHIFDVRLAFVLAVDNDQLRKSVENIFGTETNVEEYLRKFIHRSFDLPKPEAGSLRQLCSNYVDRILKNDGQRKSFELIGADRVFELNELVIGTGITPRQIQEVFRVVAHVIGGDIEGYKKKGDIFIEALILLSVVRVSEPALYRRIGSGDAAIDAVSKFLRATLNDQFLPGWLNIYLTGVGFSVKRKKEYNDILSKLGLPTELSEGEFSQSLSRIYSIWQHYHLNPEDKNYFRWIYDRIESAMNL